MSDFAAPFKPGGSCFALFASNQAPSATLVNLNGDWSALVTNRSTSVDGYLVYGPNSSAMASAAIPLINQPPSPSCTVLPVPFNTAAHFTFSGPTFLGAMTATGNTILDVVPGQGVS